MDRAGRRSSLYDGDVDDDDARGPRRALVIVLVSLVVLAGAGGAALLVARNGGDTPVADDGSVPDTEADATADLLERTTEQGLTVRLRVTDDGGQFGMPGLGADAPQWCLPSGDAASATIISDLAVAQSQFPIAKAAAPEGGGQMLVGGIVEEAPLWGVIMQVPDDVQLVRALTPGLAPDEMEPVDGMVAVASHAKPGAGFAANQVGLDLEGSSIELVFASGVRRQFEPEDFVGPPMWMNPECQQMMDFPDGPQPEAEPPSLPAPGEQPADPAAARAAVEGTLTTLFTAPMEQGLVFFDLIDDASGIDLAVADHGDEANIEQILTDGAPAIQDLVFVSPVEAFFYYDLETPFGSVVDRFGRARFIDGRWKLTRFTFCQEVSPFGIYCGV